MDTAKLVLQYLRALTSTQLVVALVVVFFFQRFKDDIKALLARPFRLRLPGGGEFDSQIERTREEDARKTDPPPTANQPPQLPSNISNISLSPDQVKAVTEAFAAERTNAALWEYRYLNYFLARGTQTVLDWLASLNARTTTRVLDTFWLPLIPSAQERLAIITALQAHHLIALTGELIEVTPKGREYIQWRGPLPPPAPPTAGLTIPPSLLS